MYYVKNVEHFLEKGGGSYLADSEKSAILARAAEKVENGWIASGASEEIFGDTELQKQFAEELGSDMEQLRILSKPKELS